MAELRHRFEGDIAAAMRQFGYDHGVRQQTDRTAEWRHTDSLGVETRVMMRARDGGIRLRLSQRVGLASPLVESVGYATGIAAVIALIAGAATDAFAVGISVLLAALLVLVPLILYLDRRWRVHKHRDLEARGDQLAALAQSASGDSEAPGGL